MFRNLKDVEGYRLSAKDGEIGHVTDLYFDDDCWAVRYLVVATGSWLFGKKVLISPNAVLKVNFDSKCIEIDLTMEQVRKRDGQFSLWGTDRRDRNFGPGRFGLRW